jgi:hypothetical protein
MKDYGIPSPVVAFWFLCAENQAISGSSMTEFTYKENKKYFKEKTGKLLGKKVSEMLLEFWKRETKDLNRSKSKNTLANSIKKIK